MNVILADPTAITYSEHQPPASTSLLDHKGSPSSPSPPSPSPLLPRSAALPLPASPSSQPSAHSAPTLAGGGGAENGASGDSSGKARVQSALLSPASVSLALTMQLKRLRAEAEVNLLDHDSFLACFMLPSTRLLALFALPFGRCWCSARQRRGRRCRWQTSRLCPPRPRATASSVSLGLAHEGAEPWGLNGWEVKVSRMVVMHWQ